MHLTHLILLPLASLALAGCPNLQKRDMPHPGGAAGIENAVTSLLSETRLPPSLSTLASALSSAGVTGVVVSETTYAASEPTGTTTGSGDSGYSQDGGESSGSSGSSGNYDSESGSSGSSDSSSSSNGEEDSGSENDDSRSRGLAASAAVPQVLLVGAAGAVGMAVLGML